MLHFWKNFWAERRADWKKSYADTVSCPHRRKIIKILKGLDFKSVLELGCNSAPNLINIEKNFPGVKLGGIDINEESIDMAKKLLPNADLKYGIVEKLPFADKSYDLILSDAVMFYLDYFEIEECLREVRRVGKKWLVMVELQEEGNKNIGSYFGRNYKELLGEFEFKNIKVTKIPKGDWDDGYWRKYGVYITAKI